MKKGRHRRFEEARALKRSDDLDLDSIFDSLASEEEEEMSLLRMRLGLTSLKKWKKQKKKKLLKVLFSSQFHQEFHLISRCLLRTQPQ